MPRRNRHVLAAAIRSPAGVIVTYNIKDSPEQVLDGYGIEVQHPDEFATHLYDLAPAVRILRDRVHEASFKTACRTAP